MERVPGKVLDRTYQTERFHLRARASLNNLLDFMNKLETSSLQTLFLDNVKVNTAETFSDLEFDITIYTQNVLSRTTPTPTLAPTPGKK